MSHLPVTWSPDEVPLLGQELLGQLSVVGKSDILGCVCQSVNEGSVPLQKPVPTPTAPPWKLALLGGRGMVLAGVPEIIRSAGCTGRVL